MTFAAELRRAMTRRGALRSPLADRIGTGRTNFNRVLAGTVLPSIEMAERLSEELDWPSLVTIVVAERTGTCVLCGATFIRAPRGHARQYCSQRCRKVVHSRRSRDGFRTRALTETRLTRARLADHQLAVAEFCKGCEPQGLCRDATCALRPVSPLRLAAARERVA